jgi:hypothetical protein
MVGRWLIPFADVVKPFQAVRELWNASSGDEAWQLLPSWPVIGWWWTCWVEGAIAGAIVGFGLVLVVPSIASAILAIGVVRSVIGRQAGLAQRL